MAEEQQAVRKEERQAPAAALLQHDTAIETVSNSMQGSDEPLNPVQEKEISGLDAILAAFNTVPVPVQPLKQGWEIPVIDFSLLGGTPSTRRSAVDQIGKACQEWGFFHVVNHGVPEKVIDDMWKAYDLLFQIPSEERRKFDHGPFIPPDILKNLIEKLQSLPKFGESRDTIRFAKLNPDDEGAIPNAPQGFREPARVFFRALRDVGFELLEAISESLGLERGYVRKVTGNNPAINSSIHYYMPRGDVDPTMGLNPHRDIDTLTVLLQDGTGGLQVLKEDRWVDVRPLPGTLVVNVGEVIQALTNGKYQSVLHRVCSKEKARSSISCFLVPTSESIIAPLPHLVNHDNPPHQPTCDWETFFYSYFSRSLKS